MSNILQYLLMAGSTLGSSYLENLERRRQLNAIREQIRQNRDRALQAIDKYSAESMKDYAMKAGLTQSSAARRAIASGRDYSEGDVAENLERLSQQQNALLQAFSKQRSDVEQAYGDELTKVLSSPLASDTMVRDLYNTLIQSGLTAYQTEKEREKQQAQASAEIYKIFSVLSGIIGLDRAREIMKSIYGEGWEQKLYKEK